jgi:hypothetical protein
MDRQRHPDKHIELAIQYAERLGWIVKKSGPRAHSWGRLFCPQRSRDGCQVPVWSTPQVPENHARHIRREVDICPHCGIDEQEFGDDSNEQK